jgi:hypothetical protein
VALGAAALLLRASGEAPATASELLRRTAIVAADQEPVPDARYLYTKTESLRRVTGGDVDEVWTIQQIVVEESWIAADGSGRLRASPERVRFPGPRDRARWEASEHPPVHRRDSDRPFAAGELDVADGVSALPARSGALLAELRSRFEGGLPEDVDVFVQIAELLAAGDASPELRSALFLAASELAGIELLGEMRDPIGRAGVGVEMTYTDNGAAVSEIMIIDPATSQLLAREEVLRARAQWVDADPGTRLAYVVYIESGRTDSPTITPSGEPVPLG